MFCAIAQDGVHRARAQEEWLPLEQSRRWVHVQPVRVPTAEAVGSPFLSLRAPGQCWCARVR